MNCALVCRAVPPVKFLYHLKVVAPDAVSVAADPKQLSKSATMGLGAVNVWLYRILAASADARSSVRLFAECKAKARTT